MDVVGCKSADVEIAVAAVVVERRLEWILIGKLSVWSLVKLDSLPLFNKNKIIKELISFGQIEMRMLPASRWRRSFAHWFIGHLTSSLFTLTYQSIDRIKLIWLK